MKVISQIVCHHEVSQVSWRIQCVSKLSSKQLACCELGDKFGWHCNCGKWLLKQGDHLWLLIGL